MNNKISKLRSGRIKWCGVDCAYATFPSEKALDGSGSCRTFLAIYCRKLKKLVPKNTPCFYVKTSADKARLRNASADKARLRNASADKDYVEDAKEKDK